MKLEKVAAIAEIASVVAIVLTLIYLAAQTRDLTEQTHQMTEQTRLTNSALNANSRATVLTADMNWLMNVVAYPELSPDLTDELDELQDVQFGALMAAFFRMREYAWLQHEAGVIDDAAYEGYMATAVRIAGRERARPEWENASNELARGFVEDMNQRLRAGEQ